MSEDPFARFERSRGGWLIPVVLFILGAIPTMLAIRTIDRMALIQQLADEPDDPNLADGDERPIRQDDNDE